MKKILSLLLLVVTIFCFTSCGTKAVDTTGISLEEFNQIKMGMKLEDVKEIIGGDGTKISESENDTDEYIEHLCTYKFNGEQGGYAEIKFSLISYKDILKMKFNDYEVIEKNQYDLS